MPRVVTQPRASLGYANLDNPSKQVISDARSVKMPVPPMTTSDLRKLSSPSAAAARVCAGQVRDLRFTSIAPGVERCSDNPAVRRAAEGLVRTFTSEFWVLDSNNRPVGTRRVNVFRITPPATLQFLDGVIVDIIPMDAAMLINGVFVDEDWCDHVVATALIERFNTNAGTGEGTDETSDKSKDTEKDGTKSRGGDEDVEHRLICFVYQQGPHGL